ncbi:nitroreductase family protein [Gilvimarinus sp. SDUM040013]|uniref:Nitroreductase family protein n=1 Tax=Gilvimarinus gilvus TaxID=3058038 RepID=A0ABU4RX68_9GAMM|nr:nitroreductase family protein [Gilvimarinus sp. SDUM040013]MDO3386634.1 nitroreductase family protein [Gilvimarinus sp. SDUM040013]MDX6849479.1 nitroreductase family protein [Gilvimarinus sp. SDUM040013]
MNTLDAIYQRRSVRHFDPKVKLAVGEERTLLEAAIQSPTCYNIQHWRFVIIRDTQVRKQLRENFGYNQSQFTDASLLILLTADTKAWQKQPERYYANVPAQVRPALVGMIAPYFDSKPWLERDEAHRSLGIAAQTLMLAAKELDYDSCAMMGFDHDKVAELVQLPADHVVGPFIAIGKALAAAHAKPGQLPLKELVFENTFAPELA